MSWLDSFNMHASQQENEGVMDEILVHNPSSVSQWGLRLMGSNRWKAVCDIAESACTSPQGWTQVHCCGGGAANVPKNL